MIIFLDPGVKSRVYYLYMYRDISSKLLSIGQIAKSTGVTVDAIRFYERKKLINEPSRSESGYRRYSFDAIRKIIFIKRAQECGFTLNEIKELLNLRESDDACCADIKMRVQEKISSIRMKINELEKFQEVLEELNNICSGKGPINDCPILDALNTVEIKNNG